jgi:CheY-like chemotaxis protein
VVRRSGLGLGLFIAGKLVALHDGTISAESAGLGKGATFTITFPRLSLPAARRPADRSPAHAGGRGAERPLAGLSILLVEDHAPTRRALAIALQQQGAETIAADSAASARVALARLRPVVVISDLGMPGEDGYAFMRKVRAAQAVDASANRVAALALSANAANRSRQRALAAGFDRFLAKPIDMGTLVSVVAELAGRAEATPTRASNRGT